MQTVSPSISSTVYRKLGSFESSLAVHVSLSTVPAASTPRHQPSRSPPLTCLLLDAGDESLQRYKESLGLGGGKDISDPNDPRVCIILSLTMDSPGRDPVTIDLSQAGSESTLKDKPFRIKENAKFTMSAKFKVQHEILSGLHYVQVVKRKGIKVSKDSEMIVRFPCQPWVHQEGNCGC